MHATIEHDIPATNCNNNTTSTNIFKKQLIEIEIETD